jgi:hypothetical protein
MKPAPQAFSHVGLGLFVTQRCTCSSISPESAIKDECFICACAAARAAPANIKARNECIAYAWSNEKAIMIGLLMIFVLESSTEFEKGQPTHSNVQML